MSHLLLASILTLAGVVHLARPEVFLAAMPPYLPWHLPLIYFTGVVELVAAVGLVLPKSRRIAALWLIAYFIAILPAHLHIAVNGIPMFGVSHPAVLWGRLFFQAVFIYWSWTIAKHARR